MAGQPENASAVAKLRDYRRKRDFRRTPEPAGERRRQRAQARYVMHKHAASHLHYDLRLEHEGVLKSWALPKGPSLEPGEKRLAVEVEDHPLEYGDFEGVIPAGEYGGGTVMLWDTGRWQVNGRHEADRIDFVLEGEKLKGAWTLVRTGGRGDRPAKQWLLIKRNDDPGGKLRPDDRSVASARSMEEIARDQQGVRDDESHSDRDAPAPWADRRIDGARKGRLPGSASPQLATLASEAPPGDDWLHEIKFDGYRILAKLRDGRVTLLSRNGKDWTDRFSAQARALARLPADRALLDGEMVALAEDGTSSFRALQETLSRRRTEFLVFQAFDLLHLDGWNLTGAALSARKEALADLLKAAGFEEKDPVRYTDHVVGDGPDFFAHACELGLEGILSKRTDGRYVAGRSRRWLKVKCIRQGEFLVGGYTEPSGSRTGFGSLLLGAWRGRHLYYAGRVGTGFTTSQLEALGRRLEPLQIDDSPFADDVPDARTVHWVQPTLVVDVAFSERTRDGRLRHPRYRGLREDRDPRDISWKENLGMVEPIRRPRAAGAGDTATVAGVRITHPGRILYPEQGASKLDLARYYDDIADWILPHIAERPLTLVRCPQGRQKSCFYQKHLDKSQAGTVPRIDFTESEGPRPYVYVTEISHLMALVQAGVLELHPFGCRIDALERPDMMVLDFDPAPGVPWRRMIEAVREMRDRLQALDLVPFLRVTGGKGLHVVVPLKPRAEWDAVKAFARGIAELQARDHPDRYTINMSKAKRKGRIFIDYLRNTRGATAIATYSTRARTGAPVAAPVRWDELGAGLRPDRYTISNLRRRLSALRADPWADFERARRPLDRRCLKAVGVGG